MKILLLATLLLLASCSDSRPHSPPEEIPEGLKLAGRSQCLTCHAVDRKVIGPSWNDVSARYNAEIASGRISRAEMEEKLARKIAMGGRGNWTSVTGGLFMPPNYPRVPMENIRKLSKFILSLGQPRN